MRAHLILPALIATMAPASAYASCANYERWYDAQVAHEEGVPGLDSGTNPGEPDGIVCEGNLGFPGERIARQAIIQIQQEIESRAPAEDEQVRDTTFVPEDIGATPGGEAPGRPLGTVTCTSFTSQADAQIVHDADPGRYGYLDDDGDGVACESLLSAVSRRGGPQSEEGRRPDGSDPFHLNTWETEGVGVAPRRRLSTSSWPGRAGCANYRYSTARPGCN